MSKASNTAAVNTAKNMSSQAQAAAAPIATNAGANQASSFTNANNTLAGAGSTIANTAVPTLQGAGQAFGQEATTGGFTPAQETAYMDQATQQPKQLANVEENQAQLAAAKTGQGNPQAAIARIVRQANQQSAQSENNAATSLNQQENANKLAGAGGLASTGSAETSAGNAQTNIGNTQATMANQSAQQQMAALGLQFSTEEAAQQALDQLSNANQGPLATIEGIGSLGANAFGAVAKGLSSLNN